MSPVTAPESRSVTHLPHLIAILSLPVLVTALLPDWVYPLPGAIDSWIYHGFFHHLESYAASLFPDTYYGTRLGWILPGYLAYAWFAPATANLVLHLAAYLAAVTAMYVIVADCTGRMTVLLATVAFGLYLPIIRTLGDDYVAAAVVVYVLLASLGAIRASKPLAGRWPAVMSGAAAAAMVHSNVGAVLLLPSVLVWIVPLSRSRRAWLSVAKLIGLWCGGALLCTVGLAVFSATHGGRWLFFQENFNWLGGHSASEYAVSHVDWIHAAPWTFLPVAVAAGAVLVLVVPWRRAALTEWQVKALASFALVFLPFLAFEVFGLGSILMLPYYVSWLYPSAFLVIGVVLLSGAVTSRWGYLLCGIVAGLLLVSIVRPPWPAVTGHSAAVLASCVALVMLAVAARSMVIRTVAVTGMLLCMHAHLSGFGASSLRADIFQAVERANSVTERFVTSTRPRFLLDGDPKWQTYVNAMASVYLWQYSVVSSEFPKVSARQAESVEDGALVVILSGNPAVATSFDQVFAAYHLRGEPLSSEQIPTKGGGIYLTMLRARAIAYVRDASSSGRGEGT